MWDCDTSDGKSLDFPVRISLHEIQEAVQHLGRIKGRAEWENQKWGCHSSLKVKYNLLSILATDELKSEVPTSTQCIHSIAYESIDTPQSDFPLKIFN